MFVGRNQPSGWPMTTYTILSGRACHLDALTDHELSALREVLDHLRHNPSWVSFGAAWPLIVRRWIGEAAFFEAAAERTCGLYRICQDIESRIGIAEGRVAPADYRDILVGWIEERFPSTHAFCGAAGMDDEPLSRALSGQKDLSIESFEGLLRVLGRRLATEANIDGKQELEQAVQQLQSYLIPEAPST